MVVAFGSRPCDVRAREQVRAPFIVGLRAPSPLPGAAHPRTPAVPSFGIRTASVPVFRGTTNTGPGGATTPAAAALAQTASRAAPREARAGLTRRTPCAACGDGAPYDATAPPARA